MKKDSLIPIVMIAFLSAFIFITIPKVVETFSTPVSSEQMVVEDNEQN